MESSDWVMSCGGGVRSNTMVSVFARQTPFDLMISGQEIQPDTLEVNVFLPTGFSHSNTDFMKRVHTADDQKTPTIS